MPALRLLHFLSAASAPPPSAPWGLSTLEFFGALGGPVGVLGLLVTGLIMLVAAQKDSSSVKQAIEGGSRSEARALVKILKTFDGDDKRIEAMELMSEWRGISRDEAQLLYSKVKDGVDIERIANSKGSRSLTAILVISVALTLLAAVAYVFGGDDDQGGPEPTHGVLVLPDKASMQLISGDESCDTATPTFAFMGPSGQPVPLSRCGLLLGAAHLSEEQADAREKLVDSLPDGSKAPTVLQQVLPDKLGTTFGIVCNLQDPPKKCPPGLIIDKTSANLWLVDVTESCCFQS